MVYKNFFKPLFDRILALGLLIVFSPVLILLIIGLFVANKGQVWFLQQRPGLHERIFYVVKFKTMNDERDKNGNLLPDEQRLTVLGQFIRKTSLDELPQLINVLTGSMSLIGPRPLLPEYVLLYTERQRLRHTIKPGITGWAQVNGRNAINWKTKFELDCWYVEHLSFALDIKIVWLTLVNVLRAKGISSGTSVTMEKFDGSN